MKQTSRSFILSIFILMLVTFGEALEVFIKINGEFVPIPGDYKLIKNNRVSKRIKVVYFSCVDGT